jgi:XTP/dITP diphosphohydrolase
MKLPRGSTLVLASHNKGKLREIAELLGPFGLNVKSAATLGLPEPDETESSFIGNALLKARAAAKASGLPALADDSGLVVAALDGAPGIYSARWAGEEKNFLSAMERVERELLQKNAADRSAKFVCALALASPDGQEQFFEGDVHGALVFPPRGDRGFGYDPIFVMDGMQETFGEIDPDLKHASSHRAKAFEKLLASGIFA